MFGNLRNLLQAGIGSGALRSVERKEGERLLEEADYAGAELHLSQAILESERRQESAEPRIMLRLELAEAQRKQFEGSGEVQKLADAEKAIREAHELASRTGKRELILQTLEARAAIAADRGRLEEVEQLTEARPPSAWRRHRPRFSRCYGNPWPIWSRTWPNG